MKEFTVCLAVIGVGRQFPGQMTSYRGLFPPVLMIPLAPLSTKVLLRVP